jgi:NAD(P)-dependent dehydrogenase (short-subunit alcohol dehydrogenase family)
MTEGVKASLKEQSGFGRLGVPEDAARLVVFLASDAACWITGQVIHYACRPLPPLGAPPQAGRVHDADPNHDVSRTALPLRRRRARCR